MKRLVEQRGDVKEIYHKDPGDGKFHIEVVQDVAQYLRSNKESQGDFRRGSKWGEGMHKVASVPEVVIAQWWKELGDNPLAKHNRKWLYAKLNSNEYSALRTRTGRI